MSRPCRNVLNDSNNFSFYVYDFKILGGRVHVYLTFIYHTDDLFQVPNPFGQDAGRGAMEGVGEEEWVVTKDKERGINIHILLFQKQKRVTQVM